MYPWERLSPQTRQRLTLVLIALIFAVPMTIAWLLTGPLHWQPVHTVNYGELIQPPRPLAHFALRTPAGQALGQDYLRGKWTLVYIGGPECDAPCRKALYDTRQVRVAQGKNMGRVQRLMVLTAPATPRQLDALRRNQLDLTLARPAPGRREALLAQFASRAAGPAAGQVYIVDPLGNLMMRYRADADPTGMRKDLKRLLKASFAG